MVLLIESGLAEEPRPALGCAGSKGHGLQHCIENDREKSRDTKQDKNNMRKAGLVYWL